ncbi:hypothetical protein AWM70_17510 [Paenibacillus yonginensis]|uniref:YetF C-terminal domain-containing protein n=1 Tax=Paenibacillus yonginensis TaxID=1462996 RepID=A0A1B1N400_9BACL|nr:YetF domain-containing protein [Paenibacillus yonginensis]ANS76160.1 hypothetical protein AWM70_17510 [Paenibacillus yonginensis]
MALIALLLFRLSGRKSISQMTIPQVAILLMVGTVLGSGVSGKLGNALVSGAILLGILVLVEWITLKWNGGEKVLKGGSVVVIQNGRLVQSHLKKLRIKVDDLEKRMRTTGIFGLNLSNSERLNITVCLVMNLCPKPSR